MNYPMAFGMIIVVNVIFTYLFAVLFGCRQSSLFLSIDLIFLCSSMLTFSGICCVSLYSHFSLHILT